MNEKKSIADTTDLQVEDSYVEDGLLNVLVSRKVSPDEKPGDPEPRWTLLADPKTRALKRIDFCVATNDGLTGLNIRRSPRPTNRCPFSKRLQGV